MNIYYLQKKDIEQEAPDWLESFAEIGPEHTGSKEAICETASIVNNNALKNKNVSRKSADDLVKWLKKKRMKASKAKFI